MGCFHVDSRLCLEALVEPAARFRVEPGCPTSSRERKRISTPVLHVDARLRIVEADQSPEAPSPKGRPEPALPNQERAEVRRRIR